MANSSQLNNDPNFDYDSRTYQQGPNWAMTMEQMESIQAYADPRRNIAPIQTSAAGLRHTTMAEHHMMENWHYQQVTQFQPAQQHQQDQEQQQQQQFQHLNHQTQLSLEYSQPSQNLDMSYSPFHHITMPSQMTMIAPMQSAMPTSLPLEQTFMLQPTMDSISNSWPELQAELVDYRIQDLGLALSPYQQPTSSPTGSHAEVLSQPSTCSDEASWTLLDRAAFEYERNLEVFIDPQHTQIYKRTLSESSYSDVEQPLQSFMPNLEWRSAQTGFSPTTQSDSDYEFGHAYCSSNNECGESSRAVTTTFVRPITIPSSSQASSPVRSPSSAGTAGSPGRRMAKKSTIAAKVVDSRITKRTSAEDKSAAAAKKVGKRKGRLSDEQRKQAAEIRKLRACLRCKFLKKTCDRGTPCAGCQPSHARLWQVPCTRIDIKEIGYFLKGKEFDFKRHNSLGFSIANIVSVSDGERILYITHGYGHVLPVSAREVFVRDKQCLKMDWIEADKDPVVYEVATSNMSAGVHGISPTVLRDYLDQHIDKPGTFVQYVDDYFGGTPFLSEMLKVAYNHYFRTGSKVIKKALKLMLAYTLTVHITMVEGEPPERSMVGKIEDETSRFHGKIMAPVMVNFQIKTAMADMWRDLHKDVLEELSTLYSSVYNGDKLKNWPTIFILASVLLAVWECMQFDCHFRVDDDSVVEKFCADMESTPVGVVVGLFSAISQKLPSILEWDTNKHHNLLAANPDAWETMTEIRGHVSRYESYLRDRPNAKFESKDFDSLSNKFVSRLVLRDIRAN